MSEVREVLIRCAVTGDGMFPTEVTVTIQTADGEVSIFADRSLLSGEDGLKATRFSVETDKGLAVCLLPIEDVDSRWVRVPIGNVKEAA